jgi:hypothetical protein
MFKMSTIINLVFYTTYNRDKLTDKANEHAWNIRSNVQESERLKELDKVIAMPQIVPTPKKRKA